MKKILFITVIALIAFISCENQDWEFEDYKYQAVYFAYQTPVRTITLGEDIYDTSLDNEHKCKIFATSSGAYSNDVNIYIDFKVDNDLVDGFLFELGGKAIQAMPESYYSLASNQITIPSGETAGGVEVQLTEAFFEDPGSIENTYVIPLVMTHAENTDSILSGSSFVDFPHRLNSGDWDVAPKDYILYAIKYINPWHGSYLRRGEDLITGKEGSAVEDETIVRREEYVVDDEVVNLYTRSMNGVEFSVSLKGSDGETMIVDLLLTFNDDNECQISSESSEYTASGTGSFVKYGEKNSWGNQDRDAIYLDYEIDFADFHYSTIDTLVIQGRGVTMETFSPVKSN